MEYDSLNGPLGLFQSSYLNVNMFVCLCHSSNIVVVVFPHIVSKELNCPALALLSPAAFL